MDNNSNVTRVEVGPQTFTRQDHEKVVFGPEPTIMVPPRHYCIIGNPIVKGKDDKPVVDEHGQVKLKHGDEEIRYIFLAVLRAPHHTVRTIANVV